ncbi:MAG TPA: ABC transporter permease [Thermomicrobiales bacterium]|nr:ABC transporter permease [Thermomicrobiales bacterium]
MTLRYVATRLAQAVVVLWGISTIVFVALRLTGDPVVMMVPQGTPKAAIDELRHQLGYDAPLGVQYVHFLGQLVRLDFGESLSYHQPAFQVVLAHLPATVKLAVAATVFMLVTGLPLGILAAVRRNSPLDRLGLVVALFGQSAPTFWLGIMLILLFSVHWRLLPSIGDTGPKALILPMITLGFFSTAKISRITRSGMLEVLRSDFLRTARAKGLGERRVLLRHALPNALISVLTVVGLEFAVLLGGAVITETVFAWPGMGRIAIQAIGARDYPLVQAVVFTFAVLMLLVNLLVDLAYPLLDPRLRVR